MTLYAMQGPLDMGGIIDALEYTVYHAHITIDRPTEVLVLVLLRVQCTCSRWHVRVGYFVLKIFLAQRFFGFLWIFPDFSSCFSRFCVTGFSLFRRLPLPSFSHFFYFLHGPIKGASLLRIFHAPLHTLESQVFEIFPTGHARILNES